MAEEKKVGRFAKISRSLRDTRGEMKKIVWPSKEQVRNNTGVVIAFMILSAILISAYDTVLALLLKVFLKVS